MSSGATPSAGSALALARDAHALVQTGPRQAVALAASALEAATAKRDEEAEVAALHALGWAQHVLGDAKAARSTLRRGIRMAERTRPPAEAGILRRLLAGVLADAGEVRAARREIESAIALLRGHERARAQVHRLGIYAKSQSTDREQTGRVLVDAATALRALRRSRDAVWEARLLNNRGWLNLDLSDLDAAEADFRASRAIRLRLGTDIAAADDTALGLAEIALRRGDLVDCLRTIDEISTTLPAEYVGTLEECRVLALTQARLLPEARAAAEAYAARCTRSGRDDNVPSVMLDLASIASMSGDAAAAGRYATSAMRSFAARGKPVNAALARTAMLRALLQGGLSSRRAVRAGLDAAAVLEAAGWRRDAARARLLTTRLALAAGSGSIAREQLERARSITRHGTVADRVELHHVSALLDIADGHPAAAQRRLARGLSLLDEYRSALGAVELRATASGIGSELAKDGLRLALASTAPDEILRWAEKLRASALRMPPVRPPDDAKLRSLQTELRQAVAEKALGRQARLESAIRARTRIVDPHGGDVVSVPDACEAARLLDERALVEYVELDGTLHALTLAQGRLTLHELGPVSVLDEVDWWRSALGRLARMRLDAAGRDAARGSAEASAAALDQALVQPVLSAVGDAPLVLVPTGTLHAVPWGALPSLRGRALVVTPSLSIWAAIAQRPRSRRRETVFVAGPRLRHAVREIHELAALRPRAISLTGKEATARATLKVLDGAALAHIACHGHFRADSPLFSALELADGPLTVYELQTLAHPPAVIVLSACDLALSGLHPGDELLGLAAALLGTGTRSVIASVVPVPDAVARRMMLAFHRHLLAHGKPADALARAQSRGQWAGFVCLGDG